MNTRWDQLKAWLVTKIRDNTQGLIQPKDVRDAFGELMDSFEVMLQYKIPSGKRRFITVLSPGQRSWSLSVNSAQSFISTFAITSKSRRILFQDVHFTVTGAGKDRTLAIIDPYFDDFLGDEKLCFEEYGVGEKIDFIEPVFGYSEVNGVKQISWKLSNEADVAFRPFALAPTPYVTTDIQHQGTALSTVINRIDNRQATYPIASATNGTLITHNKNTTLFLALFINSSGRVDYNITADANGLNQLKVNVPAGDPPFSGFLFLLTA